MILEELVISDIYSVHKKVRDGSKLTPSTYGYPCWCIRANREYINLGTTLGEGKQRATQSSVESTPHKKTLRDIIESRSLNKYK